MQTKTYFASSVPAALEVARQELGEDALLVGSKPAPAARPAVRPAGSDFRLGSGGPAAPDSPIRSELRDSCDAMESADKAACGRGHS